MPQSNIECIEFLEDLLKWEEEMQSTINVDNPDFKARLDNSEYGCWANHERNIMMFEKCIRVIKSE